MSNGSWAVFLLFQFLSNHECMFCGSKNLHVFCFCNYSLFTHNNFLSYQTGTPYFRLSLIIFFFVSNKFLCFFLHFFFSYGITFFLCYFAGSWDLAWFSRLYSDLPILCNDGDVYVRIWIDVWTSCMCFSLPFFFFSQD